jgi:uncharacterized membrane protein YphA (DoxX/SURF4 family)
MNTCTATASLRAAARAADIGTALLRTSLRVRWIAHARRKWLLFTLRGTAKFLLSVGLPAWLGGAVVAAEQA